MKSSFAVPKQEESMYFSEQKAISATMTKWIFPSTFFLNMK